MADTQSPTSSTSHEEELETVVTSDTFDDFIKEGYTFIDFWAEWCTPCKMVAPSIQQIAKDWKGKVKVGKVNTDENVDIAMRFQILGIPTFMLFKDGQLIDRMTGAAPTAMFTQFLQRNYKEAA